MKRILLVLVVVVGAYTVLGCAINPSTAGVVVRNRMSATAVAELYAAQSADVSWGPNRLSGSELAPGDEVYIRLEPGIYDVVFVLDDDRFGALADVPVVPSDPVVIVAEHSGWHIQ